MTSCIHGISPLGTCLTCTPPTAADVAPGGIPLTEDERSCLARHARYEANRQLDPRNYLIGELNPDGTQKLSSDWDTRQKRHDRWRQIADWLNPNLPG